MEGSSLQTFPIPHCYRDILKNFTREILRDQPVEIFAYGLQYFEALENVGSHADQPECRDKNSCIVALEPQFQPSMSRSHCLVRMPDRLRLSKMQVGTWKASSRGLKKQRSRFEH